MKKSRHRPVGARRRLRARAPEATHGSLPGGRARGHPRSGPADNAAPNALGRLADFGFFAALQPVAASLHGRDELRQVDLEGVEDVVRVVLGAQADLALAGAGVLDDLVGLALGLLHDLFLADEADLLLARLTDDALRFALSLRQHLLALLHDPARLLDLLGDGRAHLVEDVVDLLLVDTHLVRKRHGLSVVNCVVQLVDQDQYIHPRLSSSPLQFFLQACSHPIGHQAAHIAAEHRQLLHPGGAKEAELWRRHHVHALDVGRHLPVQLVHLELVLEIRDRPQSLDDRLRAVLPGEVDEERIKGFYLHIAVFRQFSLDERDPLLGVEHGLTLAYGLIHHPHYDEVEHVRDAGDDVDVAVRDRVVRARDYRRSTVPGPVHVEWIAIRVSPYVRSTTSGMGRINGVRLSDSVTTRAFSPVIAGSASDSGAATRGATSYGGSQKTSSNTPSGWAMKRRASWFLTSASMPTASRLRRSAASAPRSRSTNSADSAPRESASIPRAPEPA